MTEEVMGKILDTLGVPNNAEDNWYVAYCDVLGVKEELKRASGDGQHGYSSFIEKIKKAYSEVNSEISTHMVIQTLRGPLFIITERRYRIFSDNIIIAFRGVKGENDYIFSSFLKFLANLQARLLAKYNLNLRGGICYGEISFEENIQREIIGQDYYERIEKCVSGHDEKGLKDLLEMTEDNPDFVLGPTLTHAYELESKCAVYPRIILDDCLIEETRESMKKVNEEGLTKVSENIIKEDMDGSYYVNYLSCIKDLGEAETLKARLEDDIKAKYGDDGASTRKVRQKLKWVLNKLNCE